MTDFESLKTRLDDVIEEEYCPWGGGDTEDWLKDKIRDLAGIIFGLIKLLEEAE